MKANFRGVTTAHTQTGTRSHWKRRDEARKREIARSKDDKRMSSLIMSEATSWTKSRHWYHKSHAWKSKCSSDNTKRTAMLETMIAVCLIALTILISYLGR